MAVGTSRVLEVVHVCGRVTDTSARGNQRSRDACIPKRHGGAILDPQSFVPLAIEPPGGTAACVC